VRGYADGPGNSADCPACDRYAGRTYRRFDCCRPRRDPRIPGPRVVSTLPAPEREAAGYFHPVPTYPVFGPRAEEADGIEPELQPLSPGMESEPLPPPRGGLRDGGLRDDEDLGNDVSIDDVSTDEDDSEQESGGLQLAAPQQLVKDSGWKAAKRRPGQATVPTRPPTVTFRQPSSTAR
jgi:hypothetical protein